MFSNSFSLSLPCMIRFLSLVGIVKAIVLSKIVEFGATNFVSFASISILLVFCCHITGINDVDPSECLKIRPSIVAASKMVVSNMKSLPKYAESTSSSRTMNLFEIVKQKFEKFSSFLQVWQLLFWITHPCSLLDPQWNLHPH